MKQHGHSMPNLNSSLPRQRRNKRDGFATSDLAHELLVQRNLLHKMSLKMDRNADKIKALASVDQLHRQPQRRTQRQTQRPPPDQLGNEVRQEYERQQLRAKVSQTLKLSRTTTTNIKKSSKKKKKKLSKPHHLPKAYRALQQNNLMRVLQDQQHEMNRPRIRRQEISKSYLRRSGSTGTIKLASHNGIWQHNPKKITNIKNAIESTRSDAPGVQQAVTQYSYLINNRVHPKNFGSASFMPIPGMNISQSEHSAAHSDYYNALPMSNDNYNSYNPQVEEETPRTMERRKELCIHPADVELKKIRRRQKKRMPVLLFPDVAGWSQTVSVLPTIRSTTWSNLREKVRQIQPAGGGGGDKGRKKADTQIVQDLLTSQGLGYGEKLFNAAAETADRQDLLHTTTFDRGWGTG